MSIASSFVTGTQFSALKLTIFRLCPTSSRADQGYPIGGGAPTPFGGPCVRHEHFLAKTYVKTKELGPVGRWWGAGWGESIGASHGSATDHRTFIQLLFILKILTFLVFNMREVYMK